VAAGIRFLSHHLGAGGLSPTNLINQFPVIQENWLESVSNNQNPLIRVMASDQRIPKQIAEVPPRGYFSTAKAES
jgi:hypothetical protein